MYMRRSARLPWRRGPVAWRVALRANEIRDELGRQSRQFLSLRATARLFGISTQPLRDWLKRRNVRRDGPRKQFSTCELTRFLGWLQARAQPFTTDRYLLRLNHSNGRPPLPFDKLSSARFVWPRGRPALTPNELSQRIGCHSSLIIKAINAREVRARRRTAFRWEITRNAWSQGFPLTLISTGDWPPLPAGNALTLAQVSRYLRSLPAPKAAQPSIEELIDEGRLQLRLRRGSRQLFVTRSSLKKFFNSMQKGA